MRSSAVYSRGVEVCCENSFHFCSELLFKEKSTNYDVVSRRAYSGLKVRNLEQTEEVCEITVQTDLLDNCIPSDVPIHFIKIDVEGAELLVLRGAIECGFGGADYCDTSPSDIYDLLVKECGLKISLMKAWLCNKPSLSQKEFTDQYYQRRDYCFMAHT
jgi:hypothetical protein